MKQLQEAQQEVALKAVDLLAERDALQAENTRLRKALYKIAFLPFGPSDAKDSEVLAGITELAREVLTAPAKQSKEHNVFNCPACGTMKCRATQTQETP